MSKFVRDIVIKSEMEGQAFNATLSCMSRSTAMKLSTVLSESGTAFNAENISVMEKEVAPYFKSLEGVLAEDGTPVTVEEFCSSFYFTVKFTEVLSEWLTRSMPGKA